MLFDLDIDTATSANGQGNSYQRLRGVKNAVNSLNPNRVHQAATPSLKPCRAIASAPHGSYAYNTCRNTLSLVVFILEYFF